MKPYILQRHVPADLRVTKWQQQWDNNKQDKKWTRPYNYLKRGKLCGLFLLVGLHHFLISTECMFRELQCEDAPAATCHLAFLWERETTKLCRSRLMNDFMENLWCRQPMRFSYPQLLLSGGHLSLSLVCKIWDAMLFSKTLSSM